MSRTCTVCTHADRQTIDRALVTRDGSNRGIASRFSIVETSLRRHQAEHLPALLAKAYDAEEVANATDLLKEVGALRTKAYSLLLAAERSGDIRTAIAGIREARACLELLAELQGELSRQPQINVLTSPDWLNVRSLLLEALRPYPAARAAVAERLMRLEAA